MRMLQGIVIGIAITIAAAYIHDAVLPPNPAAPLLEKREIVNWDVLGRLVNDQLANARHLWNRAFGR